jgi:flagellar protein FliL
MAEEEVVEESAEDAALAAAVSAAKKKKLILLGGLIVVILLLGGGGTFFALSLLGDKKPEVAEQPAAEEHGEKAAEEPAGGEKKVAIYEALEPAFLANFLIGGRQHYVQLSLTAMAREQEGIDGLRNHMPLIRNRVVMILSGEAFENLQTDAGRVELQKNILAAMQEVLQKETGKPGIDQVFFTNFVMQ